MQPCPRCFPIVQTNASQARRYDNLRPPTTKPSMRRNYVPMAILRPSVRSGCHLRTHHRVSRVGIPSTMESAARAAAAVESTTTATVETSTSTVAAMLGKRGYGCADEGDRSDTYKKSFQQGGFPHFRSLHPTAVGCPGGQPASINPTAIWTLIPSRKLPRRARNKFLS